MSAPDDNFLSRWSRRKLDQDAVPEQPSEAAPKPAEESVPVPQPDADQPFDVASLPSIESIAADTDMSVFMRAGVPEALRREALRKIWVTDPAIRDFVGLQDYDFDFNTPGAIPGFGPIGANVDVKAMAEQLLGGGHQRQPEMAPSAGPPGEGDAKIASAPPPAELSASPESKTEPDVAVPTEQILSDSSNGASQQDECATAKDEPADFMFRRHGSALPS